MLCITAAYVVMWYPSVTFMNSVKTSNNILKNFTALKPNTETETRSGESQVNHIRIHYL